jgi:hypothetical protein
MAKALFISPADIRQKTALGGNVDADKFTQFILVAQDIHIQNVIGTKLMQRLQTLILDSSLSGNYKTLVDDYIKPALIHYAMMEYLPWAGITIGNKGIIRGSSEQGETAQSFDVEKMVQKERDIADHYADLLKSHLCAYPTRYPEYNQNRNGDIYPDKSNSNRGGWVLD